MGKPTLEVVVDNGTTATTTQFDDPVRAHGYLCHIQDSWLARVGVAHQRQMAEAKANPPPHDVEDNIAYWRSMMVLAMRDPIIGPAVTMTSLVSGEVFCNSVQPNNVPVYKVWEAPEWPWWKRLLGW